jgi:hypothetical protein
MNIFLGVLKTKSLLFEISADGSTKFGSLVVKKIKNKVYFPSKKSLTNSENHSRKYLQESCSGFLLAALDSKSCLCDSGNCWEIRYIDK